VLGPISALDTLQLGTLAGTKALSDFAKQNAMRAAPELQRHA
jgi:hypothetical protein